MRKLRACFVVAISALAACGDDGGSATQMDAAVDAPPDAKIFMDAPPPMFDFSCAGNSQPTADTTLDLSGTVQRVSGSPFSPSIAAAGNVDVDLCQDLCAGGDRLDTATSASDGTFNLMDVATNGQPLDVYFRAINTGDRTTLAYPAAPFTTSPPTVPMILFTSSFFSIGQDAGKGLMIVALVDCMNNPITDTANVDIILKQNGADVTGTSELDASMFDPNLSGAFLVFNVPANNVTNVGATWNSMPMRAHDVRVLADGTTLTLLRPGY